MRQRLHDSPHVKLLPVDDDSSDGLVLAAALRRPHLGQPGQLGQPGPAGGESGIQNVDHTLV